MLSTHISCGSAQKAALEHTTKTTCNAQQAFTACACVKGKHFFADIQTVVMIRQYFFDTTLPKRAASEREHVG